MIPIDSSNNDAKVDAPSFPPSALLSPWQRGILPLPIWAVHRREQDLQSSQGSGVAVPLSSMNHTSQSAAAGRQRATCRRCRAASPAWRPCRSLRRRARLLRRRMCHLLDPSLHRRPPPLTLPTLGWSMVKPRAARAILMLLECPRRPTALLRRHHHHHHHHHRPMPLRRPGCRWWCSDNGTDGCPSSSPRSLRVPVPLPRPSSRSRQRDRFAPDADSRTRGLSCMSPALSRYPRQQ
mmetsp:Transcript_27280/g.78458  ORF Transcript_27280/g.78458 Transcript_27280/m.78458 type:complete len:237 (+) Transcript_27280:248-958(+)